MTEFVDAMIKFYRKHWPDVRYIEDVGFSIAEWKSLDATIVDYILDAKGFSADKFPVLSFDLGPTEIESTTRTTTFSGQSRRVKSDLVILVARSKTTGDDGRETSYLESFTLAKQILYKALKYIDFYRIEFEAMGFYELELGTIRPVFDRASNCEVIGARVDISAGYEWSQGYINTFTRGR